MYSTCILEKYLEVIIQRNHDNSKGALIFNPGTSTWHSGRNSGNVELYTL